MSDSKQTKAASAVQAQTTKGNSDQSNLQQSQSDKKRYVPVEQRPGNPEDFDNDYAVEQEDKIVNDEADGKQKSTSDR